MEGDEPLPSADIHFPGADASTVGDNDSKSDGKCFGDLHAPGDEPSVVAANLSTAGEGAHLGHLSTAVAANLSTYPPPSGSEGVHRLTPLTLNNILESAKSPTTDFDEFSNPPSSNYGSVGPNGEHILTDRELASMNAIKVVFPRFVLY